MINKSSLAIALFAITSSLYAMDQASSSNSMELVSVAPISEAERSQKCLRDVLMYKVEHDDATDFRFYWGLVKEENQEELKEMLLAKSQERPSKYEEVLAKDRWMHCERTKPGKIASIVAIPAGIASLAGSIAVVYVMDGDVSAVLSTSMSLMLAGTCSLVGGLGSLMTVMSAKKNQERICARHAYIQKCLTQEQKAAVVEDHVAVDLSDVLDQSDSKV